MMQKRAEGRAFAITGYRFVFSVQEGKGAFLQEYYVAQIAEFAPLDTFVPLG